MTQSSAATDILIKDLIRYQDQLQYSRETAAEYADHAAYGVRCGHLTDDGQPCEECADLDRLDASELATQAAVHAQLAIAAASAMQATATLIAAYRTAG